MACVYLLSSTVLCDFLVSQGSKKDDLRQTSKVSLTQSHFKHVSSVCLVLKNEGAYLHIIIINVLHVISKFLEAIIPKSLLTTSTKHTYEHCGFRYSRLTADILKTIRHWISAAVHSTLIKRKIACDILKAFDMEWPRRLVHKISSYGISESLYNSQVLSSQAGPWSFVVNGQTSVDNDINAVADQYLFLSPTQFLLSVKGLPPKYSQYFSKYLHRVKVIRIWPNSSIRLTFNPPKMKPVKCSVITDETLNFLHQAKVLPLCGRYF